MTDEQYPYLTDKEELSIKYLREVAKHFRDESRYALADALLIVINGFRDAREQLWIRSQGGMDNGMTTEDYRLSVAQGGPMYPAWENKPHRLVYDLCDEVDRLNMTLADLRDCLPRVTMSWKDGDTNTGRLLKQTPKVMLIEPDSEPGEVYESHLGEDGYWYEINNSGDPLLIVVEDE